MGHDSTTYYRLLQDDSSPFISTDREGLIQGGKSPVNGDGSAITYIKTP